MGPRLLDVCCCEGAATRGYTLAGFEVDGVDLDPARGRYYPGRRFICADGVDYVRRHGAATTPFTPRRRVSGSLTATSPGTRRPAGRTLIGPMRDALEATGRPYVIENVPRAPLLGPLVLCGTMFGLETPRRRWHPCSGYAGTGCLSRTLRSRPLEGAGTTTRPARSGLACMAGPAPTSTMLDWSDAAAGTSRGRSLQARLMGLEPWWGPSGDCMRRSRRPTPSTLDGICGPRSEPRLVSGMGRSRPVRGSGSRPPGKTRLPKHWTLAPRHGKPFPMPRPPTRAVRVPLKLWTAASKRAEIQGRASTSSDVLRAALESYAADRPSADRKGSRS